MKARQSGMTLIGFLFILLIAGFFAFMALKLFPSYSQFYGITKAMKQLSTESVDGKSPDAVRREFMFKLSFQYADNVIKPQDIQFISADNGTDMRVAYDERIHFLYNIDFLLHFEKRVSLSGNISS
jgi:hypothetical protein